MFLSILCLAPGRPERGEFVPQPVAIRHVLGEDLDRWLTPFVAVMGRSTRRRWGPVYVRGLLGPDGPKSVQPIAARLGLRGHDQLHHFISSAAWDDTPLWRVLAEQADAVVGGDDAVLVVAIV